MTNESPTAPAGWYPTPSGSQRYWDGSSWSELPPPPADDAAAVQRKHPKKSVLIGLSALGAVALIAGIVGVSMNVAADAEAGAKAEAAALAEAEAQAEADAEAEIAADEAREAELAQEAADERERESRSATIPEIEAAIVGMANGHMADGIIDGPVLDAVCSPTGGGSTDDLTEQTTVFDCFVSSEDNGDGTFSGYGYNATMNWSTGSYTFGLGAP
ncbi:DUF2510 domain-containing protein [Microcella flavibacter]|uniref:DUF2510 domain-containing protein n=1 Tax=Microcella flavibacter TaxID=1804990 RepID=UPI00145749EA|nr:DUF2510 domain-containing protein [Microcella flavibacter]